MIHETNSDSPSEESNAHLLKKLSLNSSNNNPILCIHCKRTKDNGVRCLGICVADNEY